MGVGGGGGGGGRRMVWEVWTRQEFGQSVNLLFYNAAC